MPYEAVIFDFDYTLGDSAEGIILCIQNALRKLGHGPMGEEAIKRTIGMSLAAAYRALTGRENEEEETAFASYFKETADQVMVEHTDLYDGTVPLLKYLKEQGLKIGVVSTKYHYRLAQIFEKFRITGLVDEIVGGEDVKTPKPDPEGLLKLQKIWKLEKDKILYVGDNTIDARTAMDAGIPFAGVLTGTTTAEEMAPYPFVGLGIDLWEIREIIEGGNRKHE